MTRMETKIEALLMVYAGNTWTSNTLKGYEPLTLSSGDVLIARQKLIVPEERWLTQKQFWWRNPLNS